MKTFEVCFEPDRNLKIKKRQLISLCHLLKTTESGEGRTCATLLTRGIFSAVFSSACTGVQRHWKRRGRGIERQREWRRDLWGEHTHSVGGALRVRGRAGDAAAALGWGTTPRPPAVFQRGGRGGTVGDPFLHSQQKKTNTARAAITWHILFSNTLLQTHKRPCFFFSFFWDTVPPPLLLHPFLAFFPRLLSDRLLPAMPYESADHAPPSPLHLPSMADERCAWYNERTAPWVTLITDVTIRDGALCACAAAAILAMVLRWFIWLIAMVTDAGGRLTGIRGWGIIINGSSKPEDERGAD